MGENPQDANGIFCLLDDMIEEKPSGLQGINEADSALDSFSLINNDEKREVFCFGGFLFDRTISGGGYRSFNFPSARGTISHQP